MNALNRCANTKEKFGNGKVQQSKLHSKNQMASMIEVQSSSRFEFGFMSMILRVGCSDRIS